MTLIEIERRVKALEQTVRSLAGNKRPRNRKWYRTQAGRFAGDPIFEKIVKLGRAYRQSQRPKLGSKRS
jgi:hypothetical protein